MLSGSALERASEERIDRVCRGGTPKGRTEFRVDAQDHQWHLGRSERAGRGRGIAGAKVAGGDERVSDPVGCGLARRGSGEASSGRQRPRRGALLQRGRVRRGAQVELLAQIAFAVDAREPRDVRIGEGDTEQLESSGRHRPVQPGQRVGISPRNLGVRLDLLHAGRTRIRIARCNLLPLHEQFRSDGERDTQTALGDHGVRERDDLVACARLLAGVDDEVTGGVEEGRARHPYDGSHTNRRG